MSVKYDVNINPVFIVLGAVGIYAAYKVYKLGQAVAAPIANAYNYVSSDVSAVTNAVVNSNVPAITTYTQNPNPSFLDRYVFGLQMTPYL